MITKQISFSSYFKFEAKVIAVPTSFNRVGIDFYPKYFMQPSKLLEVMLFSENPKSVDYGFKKDADTGLYLKNRDKVDVDEVKTQFDFISMRPPFGYHDEATYIDWVKTNMDEAFSNQIKAKFDGSTSPIITVKENEDAELTVEHLYTTITSSTTYKFYKNKIKAWPVEEGVVILNTNKLSTSNTGSY